MNYLARKIKFSFIFNFNQHYVAYDKFWLQNYLPIQHFCQTVPIVDDHVREAMGDALYELFTVSVTHPCFSWSRVRLTRYASFIPLSKLEAHFCVCVCLDMCILECGVWFKSDPETLYIKMNHIQADVLVSNKVNIPKGQLEFPTLAA